ncbi:LacI family transcriptional regulator [Mycoplasmopsis bovirhinis]|uniref:LacI family DNA-binding transcriptional regulator n=1 Tax=Mycoplasmopsis bovirhinis TaxID=29553 RepID=UPI000BB9ED51|nr:LacI family DNA-binding transcriptional regulator [Mycoplasmopsis bovirhinis]BBA22071.1 LacI family transcriptional regulator [Mycoplasmopsis bovirhinis]
MKNNSFKNITYKEISEKTGVSISTISRYFNNGYVSTATTEKIVRFVNKHDYTPNYAARIIRGKNKSIFVIMPNSLQNKYNLIVSGLVIACQKNDNPVFTAYADNSASDYIHTIKYALSWKPLAIVVLAPDYSKKLFDFLKTIEGTSVILYGHKVDDLNWIKPDMKASFYQVTKVAKNFRTSNLALIIDEKLSESQRLEIKSGFLEACDEFSIDCAVYNLETKKDWISIQNLNLKLKVAGVKNIICSSHEVYVSIMNTLGPKEFKMTDIGYSSVYDIVKTYKAKIFIDYPKIGMIIQRMIHDYIDTQEPQGKLIDTTIIQESEK